MSQLLELATDAIGLFCTAYAWMLLALVPVISFFSLIWFHNAKILILIPFGVLFGFFLKWIANGILNRKRIQMLLVSIVLLMIVIPAVLRPHQAKPPMLVYFSFVYTSVAIVLIYGAFRKRRL